MNKIPKSLVICLLLLVLLCIFHVYNNIVVLKADRTPIMSDSIIYYRQSVDLYRMFVENKASLRRVVGYLHNKSKPPMFAFSMFPWYLMFGVDPDVACMSNLFFMIVLIFSIFLIARHFSGDYSGVLAAFIITTYPVVFSLSRWCLPYFSTLAMVSLTVLFLIRSEGFTNTKYSFLSGFTSGAAVLMHQSAVFSLFIPYIFFLFEAKSRPKVRYLNFLLSVFVIGCFVWAWIFLVKGNPYTYMAVNNNLPQFKAVTRGFIRFTNLFFTAQLHRFYSIVFMISCIPLVFRKTKLFFFLCAWYITHTMISSFFPASQTPRFNIASLGAMALITSLGIFNIRWRVTRVLCSALVVIFGLLQYLVISYYPYADRYYSDIQPLNRRTRLRVDDQVNHYGLPQANKTYWNQNELLSLLMKDRRDGHKKRVKTWIIYGKASIHGALLSGVITDRLPMGIINAATDERAQGLSSWSKEELVDDILTADYVLTYKERSYDTGGGARNVFLDNAKKVFYENMDSFMEIKTFDMPDGNVMYVYKNRNMS